MITKKQRQIANLMRIKVRELRGLGVPSKVIEKLIKSLNLPFGLQLNLLSMKK